MKNGKKLSFQVRKMFLVALQIKQTNKQFFISAITAIWKKNIKNLKKINPNLHRDTEHYELTNKILSQCIFCLDRE